MQTFKIIEEYIHLNQLIKAIGWVSNGAEANNAIENNLVKVNDVVETRKRNKIKANDKVIYKNNVVIVIGS